MSVRSSTLLRLALIGDAAASGATGLLMALGAGPLEGLLGLPETLLRTAGLILLPYAAAIAALGTRDRLPRAAIWSVIALNVVWAVESALLLVSSWADPTGLGIGFVIFQAAVVAGFAAAQYIGLRRVSAGAALAAA
jgi:hypothetical protein